MSEVKLHATWAWHARTRFDKPYGRILIQSICVIGSASYKTNWHLRLINGGFDLSDGIVVYSRAVAYGVKTETEGVESVVCSFACGVESAARARNHKSVVYVTKMTSISTGLRLYGPPTGAL